MGGGGRPDGGNDGSRTATQPPVIIAARRRERSWAVPPDQTREELGAASGGWVPITDAIEEGLRGSSSEVKQGLETLSQQIGALFLTYFDEYKDHLENNAADTREAVPQLASSVSLLTPLQDLAQPLKDLLKPIQDATGKMAELATGGKPSRRRSSRAWRPWPRHSARSMD